MLGQEKEIEHPDGVRPLEHPGRAVSLQSLPEFLINTLLMNFWGIFNFLLFLWRGGARPGSRVTGGD